MLSVVMSQSSPPSTPKQLIFLLFFFQSQKLEICLSCFCLCTSRQSPSPVLFFYCSYFHLSISNTIPQFSQVNCWESLLTYLFLIFPMFWSELHPVTSHLLRVFFNLHPCSQKSSVASHDVRNEVHTLQFDQIGSADIVHSFSDLTSCTSRMYTCFLPDKFKYSLCPTHAVTLPLLYLWACYPFALDCLSLLTLAEDLPF